MIPPPRPLRFLIYPSLGEVREHVRVELFGRVLSERLGRPVVVQFASTYEEVDAELAAGHVDMVWATSEQCDAFASRSRAVLRAVRAGSERYQAALVCRADAPLTLDTLHGQRAAWIAPRSTGGHLLALRELAERGHRPDDLFSEQRFVGTYRRALLAVLQGEADVTSIYASHANELALRATLASHLGADAERLKVFAFTRPTLADGIVLTRRLSAAEAATLESLLAGLNTDGGGVEMLMGPFSVEGFVVDPHTRHGAPVARQVRGSEYLVAELDGADRLRWVWSPSGRAFERDLEGAEGRTLLELLGSEAGEPLMSLARTVRLSGAVSRLEYRLRGPGGARSYVAELTPCARRDPGPEDTLGLVVRDVSGLRALEEPLYRLASFPLLHPEPLMELSPEGVPRYANAATHNAFPELVVQGAHHPLVQEALRWAWRGSSAGEPTPTVFHAGRYWELSVAQLWDPSGLRVFARDVTLRKQMEAQLVQADRLSALGSLAAAVGHEMNNPLAFMIANLSFAREELERIGQSPGVRAEAGPELGDVIEALTETAQGARRLKDIVGDLRTLSRKPPEHRARVDVRPVLDNALKLVRGELNARARLERDFHEVPAVDADEARLGQLFLNVLLKAVQSMDERHAARNQLRVAVYTGEDGHVVVEVQDTGRGMPPEALARLFEPFITTQAQGSGLGLSVSHAIVTSLGGALRAESHEGRGTLFTITLPAADDANGTRTQQVG